MIFPGGRPDELFAHLHFPAGRLKTSGTRGKKKLFVRPEIGDGPEELKPRRNRANGRWGRWLLLAGFIFSAGARSDAQTNLPGAELAARSSCSACHLFPDPALLPANVWTKDIFPKMRLYMGLDKVDTSKTKDSLLLARSGYFPSAPMIPESTWQKVTNYFLAKAPAKLSAPSRNEEISVGLKLFQIEPPRFRRTPALTTFVKIDEREHRIFTCDANRQTLDILDEKTELKGSIPAGNIITSMAATTNAFYLGCIGHFFPSEDKLGQIIKLTRTTNGLERTVLMSELPRIADVQLADMNNDGKEDLVVCHFGFLTGRFSWYENLGGDKYQEHVLFSKPGAVKAAVHDFNHDGKPDIAVLFGQETDGMLMFENGGGGKFTMKEIFRRAPVFGHAYFELADFNKDGAMDFLVANGDNGDYESPPKPYHGIRIYSHQQDGSYKETFFYPMHGAFKAVARDFDEDGDLDIAAVSFFPDYGQSPRESFIYLENNGRMEFTASTFRECIAGRWLTLDAGDVDGDGDIDIALGSLVEMPTIVPAFLTELWKKSPSVLILKNQLRENSAKAKQ